MTRTWAVARHMIAEGIRMRLALVFLVLLGLVVLGLPFSIEGDNSLTGRVQNFLSFSLTATSLLLSLLTIFLSRSLSEEIVNRQIFMTATKPIPRWQFMLGKWLGIVMLNAVFLLFSAGAIYGMIHYIRWAYPPADAVLDNAELEEQVLVARHSRKFTPPPFRKWAEMEFERRKEEGKYADRMQSKEFSTEAEIADLTVKNEARWRTVVPFQSRVFLFENVLCDRSPGKYIQLRYKTDVENYSSDEVFKAVWVAGDPPKGTNYQPIPVRHVVGRFHTIDIPADCVAADNTLSVEFVNQDPFVVDPRLQHPSIIQFLSKDEVEVLFVVGSFEGNFLRLLTLMLCKLMYLAAVGLLMTSILSFPVACLTSFTVYALAGMRGFLYESLEWSSSSGSPVESVGTFFSMVIYYVLHGVGTLIPDFGYYDAIETLVGGGNVSLVWVLQGVVWLALVQTTAVLGLAMLLFHFREVAEVSV